MESPKENGQIKVLPAKAISARYPKEVAQLVTNQILLWSPDNRIALPRLTAAVQLQLDKVNFLRAVKAGDYNTTKTLLAAASKRSEADVATLVDQRDRYDRTPLMWASEVGSDSIVGLLLERLDRMTLKAGEKPKRLHQNKFGWTAFDYSKTSRIEQLTNFSTVPGQPLRKSATFRSSEHA